jgi:transcriptional regulator with XRE-family HTH domain
MNGEALHLAKAEIGTHLHQIRQYRGFTQAQLANLAGISQTFVQKIEKRKRISPRIVKDLALALEVNPVWLQWGKPFTPMRIDQYPS